MSRRLIGRSNSAMLTGRLPGGGEEVSRQRRAVALPLPLPPGASHGVSRHSDEFRAAIFAGVALSRLLAGKTRSTRALAAGAECLSRRAFVREGEKPQGNCSPTLP